MERYIRTKDGKIFDIYRDYKKNDFYDKYDYYLAIKDCYEILKQSDTVEELIEVGDLVSYYYAIISIDEVDDRLIYSQSTPISRKDSDITELYTKQNNDYILVAKKENGEWRVL